MQTRTLGSLSVSSLGLGCMGMSYAYGPADEPEALHVLRRYLELGGNFLDTAEIYGPYENEKLLGRFLKDVPRERVVIATKFGFRIDPQKRAVSGVDSSPANIRKVCDESLGRLGIETIDLFYQHRVDPKVPIEDVVGTLEELIDEGKIQAIGLSEASAKTIRRAAAVYPITAVQTEYSLWSRDVESNGVLEVCRELGIGFVPYSPLGRGFLTGMIQKSSDLDPSDWRLTNPRFQDDALTHNLKAGYIKEMAAKNGCTPAQIALAWVLAQGSDIVPIPGTKHVHYLEDNMGAVGVHLSAGDLAELDRLFPPNAATGDRYPAAMSALLNK